MSILAPGVARDDELQRLRTLYQLLAALTRAKSLEDVYESALTSLLASTTADRAAILTFDNDGVMQFKAWRGLSEEYRAEVTGHTPWLMGTQNAEPLSVPDVAADPKLASYGSLFAREGIGSVAFIPLELEDGVFGKFMLYSAKPHDWSADELGVSQLIAGHVALVVQRKRAELARAQSERLLQTILDNSPAVIFLKDVQGRYRLVNRRFEELFHVRRAEIQGKTDYDIFPAETAARFQENDRKVLAALEPLTLEEPAPQDDGLHTYVSVKFPILAPEGTAAAICGIATDITDRQKLEFSSRHLAAVVESSYDAIITKDLNGIVTSWNKAAEDLLGYTASEAIGRPISFLAPPDRVNEMRSILNRIARGERVDHFETKRRTKDQRILDVSLTVSPIRDRQDRIIGASKILRDITERKRAEQERVLLLAREQEARATAELLNQVGPRLVAERDPERLIQSLTEIATAVVGAECGSFLYNAGDVPGESRVVYVPAGGSIISRNPDLIARTLRGQAILRFDDLSADARYNEKLPRFATGRTQFTFRSYLAAPVISRSGEVMGGLFFGHSIPNRFTERQEDLIRGIAAQAAIALDNARLFEEAQWAQNELKRSNEELRRTNEDLEAFAYSASHDLQEPLRTITLSSELLQRAAGDRLPDQCVQFLDSILHGSRAMGQLIRDLLAYTTATKSAEGPPPLIDSGKVFADVVENLKGAIDQAGATVSADALPVSAIHEGRLALLFQNLISNALKYRRKEAPRVHVSAKEQDGWTIFSVEDNGIGIDLEYAHQIFGLFKRLHSRDRYPGSGLGLAICQRIVEQYGGRIWLERSAVGEGSTFSFSIPRRNQ